MPELIWLLKLLGKGCLFIIKWSFKLWLWWCLLVLVICILAVFIGKYWPRPGNKGCTRG